MTNKLHIYLLGILLLSPTLVLADCQDKETFFGIFLSLHSAATRGDVAEYRKLRETSIVDEMEGFIRERKLGTFSDAIKKSAIRDAGVKEMKIYDCTESGDRVRLVLTNDKKPSNRTIALYEIVMFTKEDGDWKVGGYGRAIISGNSAKTRVEDYYSHREFTLNKGPK